MAGAHRGGVKVQSRLMFALLMMAVAIGCSALPVAAEPSLAVAATRRDASGAVYSIPAITDRNGNPQPPLLLPGEYVVVTGTGLPANQPVQAALAMTTHTFPLAYQAVNGAAQSGTQPMTDASGTFQDLTFALPPADQVTDATGQLVITVGGVRQMAPVAIVTSAATTAGAGDKRAVAFGAAFLALGLIAVLLLVRGLPTYPARRAGAGDQRVHTEAE
jgi:hypothetical protein